MKTQGKIKVIIIVVITALVASPVIAQATKRALEKRIIIPAKEVRIDSLLKIFSKQTGVEFSFNSNKISPSKKLVVPKKSTTLSQWLNILKATVGAQHKVVGNHIILVDNSMRNNTLQKSGKMIRTSQTTSVKKAKVVNAVSKTKEQPLIKIKDQRPEPVIQTAGALSEKIGASLRDSNATTNNKEQGPKLVIENAKATEQRMQVVEGSSASVPNPANSAKLKRANVEEGNIRNAIQIVAGSALHGSGDMKGIMFGAEYIRYYTKRFSLNYNFRGAINSSKDAMFYPDPGGAGYNDVSIRFTTAGVQLGVNAGLSILKNALHDFKIGLGPFVRYQSESNTDGYSTYQPAATGIPTILVGYNNRSPQETYAVGGILQFQYDFTFRNKLYIGIVPGFQTDTNGDAILQLGLTIGRRL